MRLITITLFVFFSSTMFAQNFNWTAQNSGVTARLNDVYFADSQTGWAVGDNGTIVNTTDGGQTWLLQSSGTTEILRAVFFIDANTGWAVGGLLGKAMLKTTDGGENWQSIVANNIMSNQMYDIAFADANTGWLVSFDSIYTSTDGGNTWVNENYVTGVQTPSPRALAVTSDSTAFVGGSAKSGPSTRAAEVFYRRPDNAPFLWGTSGFDLNVDGDEIMSIDFINSDIGFAGGKNGKLYRKSDYGDNGIWSLNLDLDASGAQLVRSVSFSDESNGMCCATVSASPSYTVIYHTSNSGDAWSAVPDTIHELSTPLLFAPVNDTAWVVGNAGKIYKGVRKLSGINAASLNIDVNIYPNPSTDLIHVEMRSENKELINYFLSDMTGRILEKGQWSLNSSNSRFTLSLSHVIKGMYLLKLSTAEGQSTYRVIKN